MTGDIIMDAQHTDHRTHMCLNWNWRNS